MPSIDVNGRRVLFIHIPKTGGTSVTRWLQGLGRLRLHADTKPEGLKIAPQHLTFADVDCMLGADLFDYAFTVVRNPFTRMDSEFRMRQKLRQGGFFGGALHFSTWLDRAIIDTRANATHFDSHIRPQWHFISDRLRVFRFEDGMPNILQQISRDLGIPAPATVPHALTTPGIPPVRWDRPDILRMQEFYRKDFDHFGYPDSPPTVA